MKKTKMTLPGLHRPCAQPAESAAPPGAHGHGVLRRSAVGLGALSIAGAGLLGAAPSAFATSSAPTHGRTTCAIAGDECTNAIDYANANDGGGASVLAVEADTEAHGGAVAHRVFDIRVQANSGVYDLHVYRNDNAPYNDAVWWQSRAENQNPGPSSDNSPGTSTSAPGTGADQPAGQGAAGPSPDGPKISAGQAAADATSFVTAVGYEVLGVKHEQLKSSGQKDYYQVKLELGQKGDNHGTANVWVDATSSPGTVTAVSGGETEYRDANIVPPATAQADAISATGGGSVYKTSLHGGKWRWYWVFVRSASTKYKVGVDAATGVVTQVRQS